MTNEKQDNDVVSKISDVPGDVRDVSNDDVVCVPPCSGKSNGVEVRFKLQITLHFYYDVIDLVQGFE